MQDAGDVDVLCVEPPKAKDRGQFVPARCSLAAGSVPVLESELFSRALAVGSGGCATRSDILCSCRAAVGASGAVDWC